MTKLLSDCEITVAMAAPLMPMPGTKPQPKIKMGSRMTLSSMPMTVMLLETLGEPAAMSILLPSRESAAAMLPANQTFM